MTKFGRTWQDASDVCNSMGSYLVVLDTRQEADAIEEYINTHHYPGYIGWWIGARRNEHDEFVWWKMGKSKTLDQL